MCLTCRFYDRYVENQCREDEADPVAVKDRRNLCEYWKPRPKASEEGSEVDAAKAKLAALFGEKPEGATKNSLPAEEEGDQASDPAAEAKAKLEALFKKK